MIACSSVACAQIHWAEDLEAALAKAKADHRVVFVAINMDGERANREMLAKHYRDARLAKLAKQTVNVFCTESKERKLPGVSVVSQNRAERQVRDRILHAGPDTWVVAPQHLFLGPDGKVLSSVPYRVTIGELEWVWVDAIRRVDKGFDWTLSESARAPARLSYAGKPAAGSAGEKPPTKEEIDKIIKEVKRGKNLWKNARENIPVLLRSDDKRAIEVCELVLKFIKGKRRAEMITGIGKTSPKVWWRVVTPFLSDKDAAVRRAAVEALGNLAEPKAAKALAKAFKNRKEKPEIRGCILISHAACKPRDRALGRVLSKTMRDDDKMLRARALLAAAKLEQRKTVTDLLARGLADQSKVVRQTAAWMIAVRRDADLRMHVRAAADQESDPHTKSFMLAADKAIGGGSLDAFNGFEKTFDS